MTNNGLVGIMVLLFALQIKHFIGDFLVQTQYMSANKGRFLHPGGLYHAAIHAGLTLTLLNGCLSMSWITTSIVLFEFVFHYFVDFGKVNLNNKLGLTTNVPLYWSLLGFDQLLHQLSYLGMVWFIVTHYPAVAA